MRPRLNVLNLLGRGVSLFEQLCLEEALLRSDKGNWVIINRGAEPPTVVMGISGVPAKLINLEAARARSTPVIQRYSGGGTVVVDSSTLFVSFVCNKRDVAGEPVYPRDVMRWSEAFYAPVLARLLPPSTLSSAPFALREHDYTLGPHKFAGNAQSISRERWVHHTSFLWDFAEANMELLTLPEKRPVYREDRAHRDFLRPLKSVARPELAAVGSDGGGAAFAAAVVAEAAAGAHAADGRPFVLTTDAHARALLAGSGVEEEREAPHPCLLTAARGVHASCTERKTNRWVTDY